MGTLTIRDWLLAGEAKEHFLIKDIAEHGCEGGVGGLIYYYETTAFHDEHEKEIWDIVSRFADDSGQTLMQYLSVVSKDASSLATLKNSLVWIAVESVAQDIDEERQAGGQQQRTGKKSEFIKLMEKGEVDDSYNMRGNK